MNLVKEFLQRDDLIVPDDTLHSWVVEWLKEDKRSASIQDNLKEILPLIRFELMSPAMLDRLLEDEFVQENSEVYSTPYILSAFRCHARSLCKLGTTKDGSSQVYRNIRTYASLESSNDGETAGRSEFGRHFTVENYLDWAKTKHNFGNFKVPVNPSFTDRFRKVDCEVSVYPKGTCISEEYIQNYYDSRGEQSQRKRKVHEDDHFRLDICLKLPKNVMSDWEISAMVICLQNRVRYIKRVTTKKPPVDKPTYSVSNNEVTAQAPFSFGITTPFGCQLVSGQRCQPTPGIFGYSSQVVKTSPEYKECTNLVTSIIDSVKLTDLRKENSEYIIDGNVKFIVVCKPLYNANDKES
ncbi:uncharacterized protein [Ptychodera flava]|uniref:uncharacterized protein isoform X1 n=1 Tax=Ptychodera flava TaxID=63121 RepID=UPI00396AAC0F